MIKHDSSWIDKMDDADHGLDGDQCFEDAFHDYDDYQCFGPDYNYANPGGNSALRAGKRIHPCQLVRRKIASPEQMSI